MIASVKTATLDGLDVLAITVEVDISNGLPALGIVGLPDTAVSESRERVRSALRASGYPLPPRRITVNLAPADTRKEGPAFDLAIAIGILAAGEHIPAPGKTVFLGELGLDGTLRPVRGVMALAFGARQSGATTIVVPPENSAEATQVKDLRVYAPKSLEALLRHLSKEAILQPVTPAGSTVVNEVAAEVDFTDIKGQIAAKRAAEITAAGGHNLLLTGPPGTGKTLIAKAIRGIMPSLTEAERHEVSRIHSIAGFLDSAHPLLIEPPFRAPHHSVSLAGLIGGGSIPRPGEVTLAHRGVLYLDEIPQFARSTLEALRGPLEDRRVLITRARRSLVFPTECLLVASENPCPCGYASDPVIPCTCTSLAVERYRQRLSGPLRDRFDLVVQVPRIDYGELQTRSEPSKDVRERVAHARERQKVRFGNEVRLNAALSIRDIEQYAPLSAGADQLLGDAVARWHLSIRAVHRIVRVARTISDLADLAEINETALAEALQYRQQLVRG